MQEFNTEELGVHREELSRLYKKAIENEKQLAAQLTRKLTILAVEIGDELMVRNLLKNLDNIQTYEGLAEPTLSESILWAARAGK